MNLTLSFRTRSVAELEARGFFRDTPWSRAKWVTTMEGSVQRGSYKREEEIPLRLSCCDAFVFTKDLEVHHRNTPAHQQPSIYYVHTCALPSEEWVEKAQQKVGDFFQFSADPVRDSPSRPYFDKWEPTGDCDDTKGVTLVADLSLPFGRSSTCGKSWRLEVKETDDSSILAVTWENLTGMKQGLDHFLERIPMFIRLCRAGAKLDKALRLMKESHQYEGAARSIGEGIKDMCFAFELTG
jgi:hypothetical protein